MQCVLCNTWLVRLNHGQCKGRYAVRTFGCGIGYIFRCSCHEGQPSRIRDLLHHALFVALYPIQHENPTPIQPNKTVLNQESPSSSNQP
eukprot:jgi/Chrzof1/14370/Cz09g00100.t1